MKLIILDHLKRWWLVWIAIGIYNYFILLDNRKGMDYISFPILLWLSAFALNFDLQRGSGRVLTTLPVSARQIGRAWWILSVALPTLFLAMISSLAMLIHSVGSVNGFSMGDLVVTTITKALFFGSLFYLLIGSPPGQPQNAIAWVRTIFTMGFFLGIFFIKPAFDPPQGIILLLAAAIFTVIGWFRAEQMVLQRAGFRPGIQIGKRKPGQYKAPAGFGGLPFLMQTTILRSVLFGLAILGMMTFWMSFIPHDSFRVLSHSSIPVQVITSMITAITFPLLFVAMIQIFPIVFQMRFLRTLPISPSILAATLVFLPVISMAVLCLIIVALASPVVGDAIVLPVFKSFLTTATLAAVAILLVVSRGLDILTYFLIIFGCVLSSTMSIIHHGGDIPLWGDIALSVVIIAYSFVITRRMLTRSSDAYRVRANLMNAWGGGWR